MKNKTKFEEWSKMTVEEKIKFNGFNGFVKNIKYADDNMFFNMTRIKKENRAFKEGRR